MKRMAFLRELRSLIPLYGVDNVVYIDETGFRKHAYRPHGWALRGEKIYGDISGNNRKNINLIVAQRRKRLLAPMLFEGSRDHLVVNGWLEETLPPYSPDLNPIEQTFGVLKRRRDFAPQGTSIDHIIKSSASYFK